MRQANTLTHWTALSLAKYYETEQTACRARDLYPYVEDIFHKPDQLISSLSQVKEFADYITVESPTERGGSSIAFAYFPTEETIDTLKQIGVPTELPDGTPIDDDYDVSIPDSYVRTGDDIKPPENDVGGLDYVDMVDSDGDGQRKYDASDLRRESDFSLVDGEESPEADEIADDDAESEDDEEDDFVCSYCGDTFQNAAGLGKHEKHCEPEDDDADVDDDADADDDADIDDRTCDVCGEVFETLRARCGHQRTHSDDEVDKADVTPQTTDDAIGDTDPSTQSVETPTAGAHADAVDWPRIATRLERKAMRADENDLDEIAAAYSQFAAMAVEGTLDKRMAHIALGTPVLEFEDAAIVAQRN